MSEQQTPFAGREAPKPITTEEYFGGCPQCGKNDGFFNIGSSHYFYCGEHRTRWHIGANLFSSWRDEDDSVWQANRKKYGDYLEVEPIRPEPTEAERQAAALEQRQSNQAKDFIPVVRSLRRLSKVWFMDEPFASALNAAIVSILSTQPHLVVDIGPEFLSIDSQGGLTVCESIFDMVADAGGERT